MNFTHFVNSGVFPWENKRDSHRTFVPECPRQRFMNWPFFGWLGLLGSLLNKDFAELSSKFSGAICLKTPPLLWLGTAQELFRKCSGAVLAILLALRVLFLAPDYLKKRPPKTYGQNKKGI